MTLTNLEITTPESVGISSNHIHGFLDKLEKMKICMHSFLVVRHGKIAAEGYWKPFHKDKLHRMYSVSKTFVSASIGLLCDEGKISLDDKIINFFPDKLPQGDLHPYIKDMTIRDLLMMATPFDTTTYTSIDKDWAWTFFNTIPTHPSGTIFNYDTSGSYILDVIVERVTGMPFMQYMRDKLLDPIDFSRNAWCVKAPEGNSWGGSGVMATTRDLAKFALVFLNGGEYNGKQLISKEYIKAATSRQIDNSKDSEGNRWNNGYGYQVWILDNGVFAFRGMGSQHAICVPDKDLVFVCTADTQGSLLHDRMIYENLWSEIIEKISDTLPENSSEYESLIQRCSKLAFIPIDGDKTSTMLGAVNGVTYSLYENPMGITKIGIEINGDEGILSYTNDRGSKKLSFGMKKYIESEFPETHYSGDTICKPVNRMYREMSCAAWTQKDKLVIRTYIIDDYFGNLTTTLSFKGNQIGVCMHKTAEWFLNEYQGFAGGKADL